MPEARLSVDESKVLQDAAFFEIKAAIDLKIAANFARMNRGVRQIAKTESFPAELRATSGRLYKGNHFQSYLPWQASDAIRCFDGEDIFCYRAVILWGKHFSYNLIVGGKWLNQFLPSLLANHEILAAANFHFSKQESLWDWNFDAHSHEIISAENIGAIQLQATQKNWLKISQKHALSDFDKISESGIAAWASLLPILKSI